MTLLINILLSFAFALPLALLLYFLFKKKFKDRRYAFSMCIIISYVLSGFIIVIYIVISNYNFTSIESKKFDQKEWSINKKDRFKMVENLIGDSILLNKTRVEAIEMLGEPNEIDGEDIKYLTGVKGSLYPQFYFLKIYFKDNIVIKVESYVIKDN
jgi:hypothetical protein